MKSIAPGGQRAAGFSPLDPTNRMLFVKRPDLKFEIIEIDQVNMAVRNASYAIAAQGNKGSRQMPKLYAFFKDESGATAIEYGLIAAGISVAIIAVVNGLGTNLNTKFTSISTQLK
jgi:pilus assembly protein Flp/PilA